MIDIYVGAFANGVPHLTKARLRHPFDRNSKWEVTIMELINRITKNDIMIEEFNRVKEYVRNTLNQLYKAVDGFRITAIRDEYFPECRGKVKESEQPVVLFYKRNLDLIQKDSNNVSMIGVLIQIRKWKK